MSNNAKTVNIKRLIDIGKDKGYLTYDDLNGNLSQEFVSSQVFGTPPPALWTLVCNSEIPVCHASVIERECRVTDALVGLLVCFHLPPFD